MRCPAPPQPTEPTLADPPDRRPASVGFPYGYRADRRDAEGPHLSADPDRSDRQVRDWFKAQCEALGCAVPSTTWATCSRAGPAECRAAPDRHGLAPRHPADRRQIRRRAWRPWRARSVRTLHETGYETNAPIEIVNWTNEEGSRLRRPCWPRASSPACSRLTTPISERSRRQILRRGIERIGYRGEGKPARTIRRDVRAAHRARPDPRG